MDDVNGPDTTGATATAGAAAGADNRTNLNGAGGEGSPSGAATWLNGLSAENLATVEAKGWKDKDPNAVLDSYRNLEAHSSKALTLPGKDASAEEIGKFWSKVGRPEEPGKYALSFQRDGVPDGFVYDENAELAFRNMAHKANLTADQASAIFGEYMQTAVQAYGAQQQRQAAKAEAAHLDLVREWGDPASDTYRQNTRDAGRALRELGLDGLLQEAGLIGKDGSVLHAQGAKALSRIGRELLGEGNVDLRGEGGTVNNPFDPKTENITAQGRLYSQDPDKARALIRAVGRDKEFPHLFPQGA